ncbi:unnamed protein product [Larinioides sclopetarius]|uniref:Uncharacterized protein n=2 Tax=Larinioides sclopetarius TaxID=280406 RepID=A0AAV1ZV80_9ARAC
MIIPRKEIIALMKQNIFMTCYHKSSKIKRMNCWHTKLHAALKDEVLVKGGKMFPSKLPLLFLCFLVAGTALTYARAMPIDEYDYPINDIENEVFEEEISADKNGIVDDEEVEEGEAEERNVLNELDAEIEEEEGDSDKDSEEDEPKEEEIAEDDKDDEEEEFEEEIADAEEGDEYVNKGDEGEEPSVEEEEKAIAEEEETIAEEEKIADEEEEASAEEEKDAEEEEEEAGKKGFPYSWYDKVKKFFKGEK